jgi:hypothetical protein
VLRDICLTTLQPSTLRFLPPYGLRRLVLPESLEARMSQPPVTGPCRELNLGHKPRFGPSGIFSVRPGDGDEWRSVGPDALELRHDGAAKLDTPAGADAARIDQFSAVAIADQERVQSRLSGLATTLVSSWTFRSALVTAISAGSREESV